MHLQHRRELLGKHLSLAGASASSLRTQLGLETRGQGEGSRGVRGAREPEQQRGSAREQLIRLGLVEKRVKVPQRLLAAAAREQRRQPLKMHGRLAARANSETTCEPLHLGGARTTLLRLSKRSTGIRWGTGAYSNEGAGEAE